MGVTAGADTDRDPMQLCSEWYYGAMHGRLTVM